MFKAGVYRSYPNYASAARTWHVEDGYEWTDQLDLTSQWVTRSVLRGIGPATQSCPFKMARLLKLPLTAAVLTPDGPMWPVAAALLGTMFLMCEVEKAAARVHHLTFDHEQKEVTWLLSMSKTDLGVRLWHAGAAVPIPPGAGPR